MEVTPVAHRIELLDDEHLSFKVDCGTTLVFDSTYKDPDNVPIDVTGYEAVVVFASAPGGAEYFRLTHGNGIAVGTDDGKFTVTVSDTDTAKLQSGGTALRGVCAMNIKSPTGVVTELWEGVWVGDPSPVS